MGRKPNICKSVVCPQRRDQKSGAKIFSKEEIDRYRSLFEKRFGRDSIKNKRKKNSDFYMEWDSEKLLKAAHSKAKDGISLAILDYKLYLELWRRELYSSAYPREAEKA
jgi:hypothetical protein